MRGMLVTGLILAVVLTGCATPIVTRNTLGEIEVNKTTRAQVHKMLGKPTSPGTATEVWEFALPEGKVGNVEISYYENVVVDIQSRNLPEGTEALPQKE